MPPLVFSANINGAGYYSSRFVAGVLYRMETKQINTKTRLLKDSYTVVSCVAASDVH